MKNLMDLSDRERRYWMWRLAWTAVAHMDARAERKASQTAAKASAPRASGPDLDMDLPLQITHPME